MRNTVVIIEWPSHARIHKCINCLSLPRLFPAARSALYETISMEPGDGSGELSTLGLRPPVTDANLAASAVPRIFHPLKPAATGSSFTKFKSLGRFVNI
jgi:hypothetical protein